MSKHKYIETPEALYQLFDEYRTEVKSNPRTRKVTGNKAFIISEEKLERPLTMDGFEVFCWKKGKTVNHYFDNQSGSYDDYCTICLIIKKEIRQDQIDGGMVGQYNASITQRLNNLKEQVETEIKGVSKLTIE